MPEDIRVPIASETLRTIALPAHCDDMGHVSTLSYMSYFEQAQRYFFIQLGWSPVADRGAQLGWADVSQHIEYRKEILANTALRIESVVLGFGKSSIRHEHVLLVEPGRSIAAKLVGVTVRFHLADRRALPVPDKFKEAAHRLGMVDTDSHRP